jgi:hypothetical protein
VRQRSIFLAGSQGSGRDDKTPGNCAGLAGECDKSAHARLSQADAELIPPVQQQ